MSSSLRMKYLYLILSPLLLKKYFILERNSPHIKGKYHSPFPRATHKLHKRKYGNRWECIKRKIYKAVFGAHQIFNGNDAESIKKSVRRLRHTFTTFVSG